MKRAFEDDSEYFCRHLELCSLVKDRPHSYERGPLLLVPYFAGDAAGEAAGDAAGEAAGEALGDAEGVRFSSFNS